MMHTTLHRSAHADQLEAELREALCCTASDRCPGCRAKANEVRAARRDAVLHSITAVRSRRLRR